MKRFMLVIVLTICLLASSLFAAHGAPVHAASQVPTSKTCQTLNLSGNWWEWSVKPHLTVPVCYDGTHIWQNGPVTAWVNTFGYVLNGISWSGTYNNGGSWLGSGENYTVGVYSGLWTLTCITRWMIDANGKVFSYDRGC